MSDPGSLADEEGLLAVGDRRDEASPSEEAEHLFTAADKRFPRAAVCQAGYPQKERQSSCWSLFATLLPSLVLPDPTQSLVHSSLSTNLLEVHVGVL